MRCHQAQELFSPYLDGILSPTQKLLLEKHLANCPNCREELVAWEETVAAIRNLKLLDPPEDFSLKVKERLPQKRFLWRRFLPLGAAAAVLLLLMVGSFAAGLWGPEGLQVTQGDKKGQAAGTYRVIDAGKIETGQLKDAEAVKEELPESVKVGTAQEVSEVAGRNEAWHLERKSFEATGQAAEHERRIEPLKLNSRNQLMSDSAEEKGVTAQVYSKEPFFDNTLNVILVVDNIEIAHGNIEKLLLAAGGNLVKMNGEQVGNVKELPGKPGSRNRIIQAWLPREYLPQILFSLEQFGKVEKTGEITGVEEITKTRPGLTEPEPKTILLQLNIILTNPKQ
ncbi:MAG: hypothetical protein PWP65_1688 [Clostridia bacterium]|nr:hypothetical protein [Clostridia bacterium]